MHNKIWELLLYKEKNEDRPPPKTVLLRSIFPLTIWEPDYPEKQHSSQAYMNSFSFFQFPLSKENIFNIFFCLAGGYHLCFQLFVTQSSTPHWFRCWINWLTGDQSGIDLTAWVLGEFIIFQKNSWPFSGVKNLLPVLGRSVSY